MGVRILVVEDHRRVRDAIALVLGEHELTLVATAERALAALADTDPQIILVDLNLPDRDGVELIAQLSAVRPSTPVLVLTVAADDARILAALGAGARGYLFKEELGRRLASAIDEIFQGGVPMSARVARLVLAQLRAPRETGYSPILTPTEREHEVLALLARSLTYDEIGATLGISVNTVRTHVRALYDKLDVCTRTEAVMSALDRGLIAKPN